DRRHLGRGLVPVRRPRGRLGRVASQVRHRRERAPRRPAAARRGIGHDRVSHFVYHDLTASLVPKWMRFPLGWTYLTGAGSLAAAAGMLFGVYPRLAANLEAAMLWIITLLVWVPRVASMPQDQGDWTEFFISSAIATGTWVVADTYRSVPWLASGKAAHAVSPD